ncbi:ribonuclease M5 [bacterium]|nr:ribonuclease M5 [bacterium]
MQKEKIKLDFVIVVEGKTDTIKLQKLFDVKTIETNGFSINETCKKLISNCIKHNINLVFLLDPDVMGNKIRDQLNELFPNQKNVFLQYKDIDKNKHKIGIAEAYDEILIQQLSNLTFKKQVIKSDLTWNDFLKSELIFNKSLKNKVLDFYHLPLVNNKKLFKYLLMLNISKKELEDVINN